MENNRSHILLPILVILLIVVFMIPISAYLIENPNEDPLETSIYELGNLTLNDVFEKTTVFTTFDSLNGHNLYQIFNTNLFQTPQLVTNGDFSDGTTGWSIYSNANLANVDNNLVVNGNAFSNHVGVKTNVTTVSNNKYYNVVKVKVTDSNALSLKLESTLNTLVTINNPILDNWYVLSQVSSNVNVVSLFAVTTTYVDSSTADISNFVIDFAYSFNISTLISNKQYSPIYDTTFDLMSDAQIKTQMDDFVANQWKFIDYTDLGIDFLTDTEITLLYNYYIDLTYNSAVFELMYNFGLTSAKWDYYHELYLYYSSL